jgi:hypothetical protein
LLHTSLVAEVTSSTDIYLTPVSNLR